MTISIKPKTLSSALSVGAKINADHWDAGSALAGAAYRAVALDADGNAFEAPAVITPKWFGAKGDGATDDTEALQNFFNYITANEVDLADASGLYKISTGIVYGPSEGTTAPATLHVRGRMRLVASAAIERMFTIRNAQFGVWNGSISCLGTGSTSISSRTCVHGVWFSNSSRFRVTGSIIGARLSGYDCAIAEDGNNTGITIGLLRGSRSGSYDTGDGTALTASWSNPQRSGSASDIAQRTVVDVDVLPPEWVEDSALIASNGSTACFFRIGDDIHMVRSIDREAGTLTLYPWVKSGAEPGTGYYIYGGACHIHGSDSNMPDIGLIDATACGIAQWAAGFYGSKSTMVTQLCGIALAFGEHPTTSMMGGEARIYFEGNSFDIVQVTHSDVATHSFVITSEVALNWSKVRTICPLTAEDLPSPVRSGMRRVSINYRGRTYQYEKRARGDDSNGSSISWNVSAGPHRTIVTMNNSRTVTLDVDADLNRLFGYDSMELVFIGTGTNGKPSGNFTFNPPEGWSINGGTAGEPGVIAGPSGNVPARFLILADYVNENITVLQTA